MCVCAFVHVCECVCVRVNTCEYVCVLNSIRYLTLNLAADSVVRVSCGSKRHTHTHTFTLKHRGKQLVFVGIVSEAFFTDSVLLNVFLSCWFFDSRCFLTRVSGQCAYY